MSKAMMFYAGVRYYAVPRSGILWTWTERKKRWTLSRFDDIDDLTHYHGKKGVRFLGMAELKGLPKTPKK